MRAIVTLIAFLAALALLVASDSRWVSNATEIGALLALAAGSVILISKACGGWGEAATPVNFPRSQNPGSAGFSGSHE